MEEKISIIISERCCGKPVMDVVIPTPYTITTPSSLDDPGLKIFPDCKNKTYIVLTKNIPCKRLTEKILVDPQFLGKCTQEEARDIGIIDNEVYLKHIKESGQQVFEISGYMEYIRTWVASFSDYYVDIGYREGIELLDIIWKLYYEKP